MLKVLPQLDGGCINYWEAGNWALNFAAEPHGLKTGPDHRHVHLHLLGRSRNAADPAWQWGEAPKFPDFSDRKAWASKHKLLSAAECHRVVTEMEKSPAHALWFQSGTDFAVGDVQRLQISHGRYACTASRPLR